MLKTCKTFVLAKVKDLVSENSNLVNFNIVLIYYDQGSTI